MGSATATEAVFGYIKTNPPVTTSEKLSLETTIPYKRPPLFSLALTKIGLLLSPLCIIFALAVQYFYHYCI